MSSSRPSFHAAIIFALGLLAAPVFGQADGSQRWAFSTLSSSTAGNIVSSPAQSADGTLYIGVEVGSSTSASPGGRLLAIRPDGTSRWTFSTPEWIDSTPAIGSDGTAYFGCWDGNVYAVNPDGTQKWAAAAGPFVSASVALAADGTVYAGSGGGNLYAFASDGTLKWSFPTADWIDSSPAVGPDGTIYFGSWDNNVYAVRPDGTEKWHYTTGGEVVSSPALGVDGTIYVGSRDLLLYAFTPYGVLKWSVNVGDTIETAPALAADGTVYVTTTGGRIFAFNSSGTELWRYPRADQPALSPLYSSPAVRADGAIIIGTSDNLILALNPDGSVKWQTPVGDWVDSSPLIASDGTIYVGCADKRLYALNGNGQALNSNSPWPGLRRGTLRRGQSASIAVSAITGPTTANPGAAITLASAASANEGSAPAVQWLWNGSTVTDATTTSLTLAAVEPANAGIYSMAASNALTSASSANFALGLTTAEKLRGDASEVGTDIVHPNGNVYDQLLLEGPAATITADAHQTTRISYIDLSDDIVQVEFSGAGTLTLVLEGASAPAPPLNYNQPDISYVKGHAGIIITGADETTNVSVFSVGRITAVNQALFYDTVDYDGRADLAYIAIASPTGKFGGLRAANACFEGAKGVVGIFAPGIAFAGPVYVGNITASDRAAPMLMIGSTTDFKVTGGDLFQPNQRPVQVGSLAKVTFSDGTTSHGETLPARANLASFELNSSDVTLQVVQNPSP